MQVTPAAVHAEMAEVERFLADEFRPRVVEDHDEVGSLVGKRVRELYVEEGAQESLPEHEENHGDPGGGEHVTEGPAHAHQRGAAEVVAPDEQVRDRDEVVRVVAVLEPQGEGEPQEEEDVHRDGRPTVARGKKVSCGLPVRAGVGTIRGNAAERFIRGQIDAMTDLP